MAKYIISNFVCLHILRQRVKVKRLRKYARACFQRRRMFVFIFTTIFYYGSCLICHSLDLPLLNHNSNITRKRRNSTLNHLGIYLQSLLGIKVTLSLISVALQRLFQLCQIEKYWTLLSVIDLWGKILSIILVSFHQ